MPCAAPTFSLPSSRPALPLPTYSLLIFFFSPFLFFFSFYSLHLFLLQRKTTRILIFFFFLEVGGTRPWSFRALFKTPAFFPNAQRRLALSDICSIYFYLKEKLQLPSHSQLPRHPSQPSVCPPAGLRGVRAELKNLLRDARMDETRQRCEARAHTQSACFFGLGVASASWKSGALAVQ